MEDIITRTGIGKTWTRIPMESKIFPKISGEDRKSERPVFKCHKCGSTSHLANTCTKKTKINEVQVIEEVQCSGEVEEADCHNHGNSPSWTSIWHIPMPYPIYGNLAISIIIGQIVHCHSLWPLWSFHHLGQPGPFTIIRPFLASFFS
ncbi:hypothetical protein O181_034408 [Austropuccinia psidii MF-1]|uniref:CCHC-type domain-containing protein n=1 Tax=Austropuccinia psidii MF-1 TaxID=1389203 RepID=A0A9Q3H7B5_9BASI|nr:hypothetical protein [Austropuccinia psidii MF-1]